MHRPKDVADSLGISPATLRLWSNHFASVLSPAAQKATTESGTPAQRRYTDHDVVLFKRAKELLGDGKTYEDTLKQLQEEPRPEEPAPRIELPTDWQAPESSAIALNLDEHPVFIAFREALAAKDQTIASKDETIIALNKNLNDVRDELKRSSEEQTRLRTLAERSPLPWWKRLFGASMTKSDTG